MIRFKKSDAADVPAPPAGYATLFVDTATGLPAAKGSDGIVVSLKGDPGAPGDDGVGIPAGGTVGQVVTRTVGGAAWQDAPSGGEGGAPFVDALADAYLEVDEEPTTEPHEFAYVQLEYEASGASRGLNIVYPVPAGKIVQKVRVTLRETLSGLFTSMAHTGDFERPSIIPLGNDETGEFVLEVEPWEHSEGKVGVGAGVALENDGASPRAAYLGFELVGFAAQLIDIPDSSTLTDLDLVDIPVVAASNGGSGGCTIAKADHPAATVIEILGYYDYPARSLVGVNALYPPAWPEEGYVAVTPTAIENIGEDGDWGWIGGSAPIAFPKQQPYLCKVSIDGAAPAYALLLNAPGYVS